MYSDTLAATGKYSKATLDAFDKFQRGMLIRTLVLFGVLAFLMVTVASIPKATGPSFLIPLGMMALAVLVYVVLWIPSYWKLNRLFAADRSRRRQGLSLDLSEVGVEPQP